MNAIEIKKLNKEFPGFRLADLSLTLPAGCILGLVGENGAGKSTTIRLILEMLRPDSGTVTVLGRDRIDREEVGVVLDEVGIPECLNSRQVGKVMAGIYRSWDQAAYEANLKKLAIPEKKPFKEFSRGMKMKLGIAVAMSHRAKLLILDEATSGLDPVVRDEVVEMFREFTREPDHSVLISSHIVSDLEKLCDYVAFLHRGRLLVCEEKDVLLERYGVLHCAAETLDALDPAAVLGRRITPYGAEAVVRRDGLPGGMTASPVSMEELFLYMVKEAN